MLKIFARYIVLLLLCFSNTAIAALNGGSSSVSSEDSLFKDFSENLAGVSLALGKRFNLAEDIFFDSEERIFANDEIEPTKQDHIFTEIELFVNQFFSGEIDQDYGARFNLGYERLGFRFYFSGGYVGFKMDYQETGNPVQSISDSAIFSGVGLGYDLTDKIGLRLDSKFYNFDFTPDNSGFESVEVNVTSVTLGLSVHF